MVNVNVDNLKSITSEYSNTLKKEKENNSNIYKSFNELPKYWHDTHSEKMASSYNTEKQRIIRLTEDIEKQLEIYKYLENSYSVLGNKIMCDKDNVSYVLSKLDIVIDQLDYVKYQYDNLGDISFYPRAYLIYNEREEVVRLKNSFIGIKNSIQNEFKYVDDIEKAVSDMVDKCSVEQFIANNYECED